MTEPLHPETGEYTTDEAPEPKNGQTLLLLLGIACALVLTGSGLNWLFN